MDTSIYDYQVTRKSSNIMKYVERKNKSFTIEEIVAEIFNIKKTHKKYIFYVKAVETFLKANRDFSLIQDGIWIYGSKPVVRPTVMSSGLGNKRVEQVISYVERVKGYIKVSQPLASSSRIRLRNHGTLDVTFDNYRYEFQWKWVYNHCYLYGNGVMDFFADANISAEQELSFRIKEELLEINVYPYSENSTKVHHRKLNEIQESLEEDNDRPAFVILYELISCYPEGLNLKEIFQLYIDYKMITQYDLKNLLKQNECFEYDVMEDIWKVSIDKISRYYKDEFGNEKEYELTYSWLNGEKEEDNTSNYSESLEEKEHTPLQKDSVLQEPLIDNSDNTNQKNRTNEDELINTIRKALVNPASIKAQIDALVVECFNKGEIQVLGEQYKEAQRVYQFFQKAEQIISKWEGKNL